MTITSSDSTYGRAARERLDAARDPSPEGALAALETFYHAFNQRSLTLLGEVWLDDPLVQLNNPLGGILLGAAPIRELYARVFDGPVRVWVEFSDIVEFRDGTNVTFAGRENGECQVGDIVLPLAIRTSRVFRHVPGTGWRQVHHHGSIDDPDALRAYQQAVRGPAPRT